MSTILSTHMTIGIIGVGVVGEAIRRGFAEIGHTTKTFDIKDSATSLNDVLSADVVFVCVPSPQSESGRCDISIVERTIQDLATCNYTGLVAIKSTVEPGTVDRLSKQFPAMRLSFCPEFLRQRCAYEDFMHHNDVCVIGVYSDEDFEVLQEAHGTIPAQFSRLSPLEAEFTKYFINCFNALRVLYASQFYDVCKKAGADYAKIKEAATKHHAVPDIYLDCNDSLRGFGGACLPKDTSAFAYYTRKLLPEAEPLLFEAVVEINKQYGKNAH